MKLLVLIPAYNEEDSISQVIENIMVTCKDFSPTVLVIDDGSTDNTRMLAAEAGAIVKSHTDNRGVGSAFTTGLNEALEMGADVLVNIDADGQFSPDQIPLMIAPILNGEADFVSGNRFENELGEIRKPENMSAIKYWGNQRMSRLISILTGKKYTDVSCGFRAYSKEAMLRLNLTGKFTYTQETFLDLANKGLTIQSVPVDVKYFPDRKSRVAKRIGHYAYRTINIILRAYRDYRPLRFFVTLGSLPLIIGLACSIFILIHYIQYGTFTPYKVIGLIGVYLVSLAIILWIIGVLADMFVRLRLNQEQILYYQKREKYSHLEKE